MIEYVGPNNRIATEAIPSVMKFLSELETLFKHTNAYRVSLTYFTHSRVFTVKFYSFEGSTIASLEVPYNAPTKFVMNSIHSTGEKYRFTSEEPAGDELAVMRYVPLYS